MKDMKIAIAGFGLEGCANLAYFRERFPDADFTIFDERNNIDGTPSFAKTVLGENAFAKITNFDLVLRTAGLAPYKIAQKSGIPKTWSDGISRTAIWSSTNEFFANCPAPIIGVTGTKGKGTTSTMIAEILREQYKNSSRKIHLLGNIGVPSLEILPEISERDFVVFELSSFQLWDLQFSPHIAVVLRIEPDHLNVHRNFADYVNAKAHIAKFQTVRDAIIFYENNEFSRQIAEQSRGQKIPYPDDISLNFDLNVPGEHNRENAKAAITAAKCAVPEISDETVKKGLGNFQGLPHRLEFVREINGVKYYDDNYSSAPGATIAAIRAFAKPEILILGGIDKGADYDELIREIKNTQIREIILIGTVREKLAQIFRENGIEKLEILDNPSMREIILAARNFAKLDDVVIMSPAHASFDMFKNFTDRGEQFRIEVEKL